MRDDITLQRRLSLTGRSSHNTHSYTNRVLKIMVNWIYAAWFPSCSDNLYRRFEQYLLYREVACTTRIHINIHLEHAIEGHGVSNCDRPMQF